LFSSIHPSIHPAGTAPAAGGATLLRLILILILIPILKQMLILDTATGNVQSRTYSRLWKSTVGTYKRSG
jgi:hypothetical protein